MLIKNLKHNLVLSLIIIGLTVMFKTNSVIIS